MLPLTRTTAIAVIAAALLLAVPLAGAHGASADERSHAADEHGRNHDHDDSNETAANESDEDEDEDDGELDPAWAPVEDAERLAEEDQSARAVLFSPTPAREVIVDVYADPSEASATVSASTLAEATTGNSTLDAALSDALADTPAEGLVGTQANATATASAGVDAPEAP